MRRREGSSVGLVVGCLSIVWIATVFLILLVGSHVTGEMDPSVVASLAAQGIHVSAVEDTAAVPVGDAIGAARMALPLVGDSPVRASLVAVTDDTSRHNSQPTINREAWALTFGGVQVPINGPPPGPWGTYTSSTVVFVDARTEQYVEAVALSSNRSALP
jgi:hypothetical protein